jgi:hypothetical protein
MTGHPCPAYRSVKSRRGDRLDNLSYARSSDDLNFKFFSGRHNARMRFTELEYLILNHLRRAPIPRRRKGVSFSKISTRCRSISQVTASLKPQAWR